MKEVVKVKLGLGGEEDIFLANGMQFLPGEKVIIESDRGLDCGTVAKPVEQFNELTAIGKPLRKVVRKLNPWDHEQLLKNKAKSKELTDICEQKIKERNLPMKLVDAEYSFDRSKIMFYFTSDNRVDFRELVKDLASIFRVRIELKQIGVRDEARMVGGCGSCGKELCCATFLKGFAPVTIKMAKVQNLPLNPAKISGLCGRLMCCLGYEYECYRDLSKGLPKVGKEVKTEQGKGRVLAVNILKRMAVVDFGEGKIKNVKFEVGSDIGTEVVEEPDDKEGLSDGEERSRPEKRERSERREGRGERPERRDGRVERPGQHDRNSARPDRNNRPDNRNSGNNRPVRSNGNDRTPPGANSARPDRNNNRPDNRSNRNSSNRPDRNARPDRNTRNDRNAGNVSRERNDKPNG
jgi:cell fate regulator YaaT (PSP1 superfamily)